MSQLRKHVGRIAVLAWCLCMPAMIGLASAKDESSVIVEKKVASTAEAPVLTQPANELTLPPPSKPVTESAPKKSPKAAAKQPFMRPSEPKRRVQATNALQVVEEPMPAPAVEREIEVRPAPPIKYDTDGDARRMYRRSGEVELVMVTQNPGDGCFYEIPLCIPACCTGEPTVSSGHGIFGRGVVEYCWPGGFRAVVKFRHVLGDVRVDYEGD